MYEKIYLKKNEERRLELGHLWAFSNELKEVPNLPPGSVVELISSKGKSFGYGYFNPSSLIAFRSLKTNSEINEDFYLKRIESAFKLRQRLMPTENSFRLAFGESDFLPGVVIDKYEDYFALQILSYGAEHALDFILSSLLKIFPSTKGIALKNKSNLRNLEGLPLYEKTIYGEIPDEIMIKENGINLSISILEGQKTGYFFDQKLNRLFVQKISKDLQILDCFCNQGGFALNAAFGSASKAVGVDVSAKAIESAINNAKINNLNNTEFIKADVFEFLDSEIAKKAKWDAVLLDPPAFAKNKKSVPTAKKGYEEINAKALKLIKKGGFLFTSSCSQHIYEDVFLEIILKTAAKQNRNLKMIYRGEQAPDHLILAAMPETRYLKFFAFQAD